MATSACIFDFDNCVAGAKEVGESVFEPAFNAIRNANRGTLSDEELKKAFADCWRHPLDWVAKKHGFSEEMLTAGWNFFKETEVQKPLYGYGDLHVISELGTQNFLVTSGFRKLQESKIRALNSGTLFAASFVDAIDEPNRIRKHGWFQHILKTHSLTAERVLVIGDNPDSEIEAGNRLGMRTVQILRPEVPRGSNATHYIRNFTEIKRLL